MNIVHTNKYNKKLRSPGSLNSQEIPVYKRRECKTIMLNK